MDVEDLPDGSVVVRGASASWVRARLTPSRRGRPTAALVAADRLHAAVAELREYGLPVTQADVAAIVDVPRTRLRESVALHFGSWESFCAISAANSATRPLED